EAFSRRGFALCHWSFTAQAQKTTVAATSSHWMVFVSFGCARRKATARRPNATIVAIPGVCLVQSDSRTPSQTPATPPMAPKMTEARLSPEPPQRSGTKLPANVPNVAQRPMGERMASTSASALPGYSPKSEPRGGQAALQRHAGDPGARGACLRAPADDDPAGAAEPPGGLQHHDGLGDLALHGLPARVGS